MKVEQINELIQISKKEEHINIKEISDGHHTFQELYNQITILWAIMCNTHPTLSWKSKKHDGEENNPMFNGDFIVGINTPNGTATRHIKLEYWDLFSIQELEHALPYDGYSPEENTERLLSLINHIPSKD